MPITRTTSRFRTRKDAERALVEIVEDGGRLADFRIERMPEGGYVITVLDDDGKNIAGMIGA